jgi:hypothetical protein
MVGWQEMVDKGCHCLYPRKMVVVETGVAKDGEGSKSMVNDW